MQLTDTARTPTGEPGGPAVVAGSPTGRRCPSWTIRPLDARDRAALVAGFAALSPQTRRRRYLGLRGDLSDDELDRITGVATAVPAALGAVDQRGRLVGVARFGVDPADPATAHVGIVVGDPWQGCRVGTALLAALAGQAAALGLRRFVATTYLDNAPVRHLLQRAGARRWRWLGEGVVEAEVPLPIAA